MGIAVGLLALLMAPAAYLMFGMRKTKALGPAPEGSLRLMLFGQLWLEHGLAASLAAYAGSVLVAPRFILLDFPIAALVGIPVGYVWGRLRMRKTEIRAAGPEPSVAEDKLFPSDRLARLLHEGFAMPLPAWIDIPILLLCVCTGGLSGLGLIALGSK